jgi:ribosomal protein S18 acetylase RimI-like enzyme
MSVLLRKATILDIPVLLELEESVTGTNIYSPMLEESEWEEELLNNFVFLIEKDGEVVGNMSYEKKEGDHMYISGLVVGRQFQGKGIAREAMSTFLEEFKEARRIDLVTHPENTAALRLYRSLGFVDGSLIEDFYGDGESRLMLILQKR